MGAGEMAPQLRTHTALTEAMSSILVPALPEDGLQPAIAPALGESHSLFQFPQEPEFMYTHTQLLEINLEKHRFLAQYPA